MLLDNPIGGEKKLENILNKMKCNCIKFCNTWKLELEMKS